MKNFLSIAFAAAIPLFAGSPTPVSVTPASQTYNITSTTAYTFVASDSAGAADLLGIDAQFGSPGEVDCWLFYNRSTNQISANSNAQGWVTEPAGQPGATLYGNSCNLDPSTVSASASGNNLSFSATITLGGAAGTNSIDLSALNVSGTGSPYVKLGTYTVKSGSGGQFTVAVSPDEGFIANGGTTTATVTITDGPGFTGTVNLSLGTFPNGSDLSGSFSQTSITGNGSSTLTITSSAESPTSRDPVTVYATTADGVQQTVTFTTMIDTGPPTVGMGLGSGSGTGTDFGVDVEDGATAEAIQGYDVLFNTTVNGQNACWVWYDARTNYIWLANDDASSWSGVVLNGPVTVSNSQCTVGSFNSSVDNPRTLGTALSTSVQITFKPGFAGTKNVYSNAANFAGFSTGYQLQGTYTVQ
jgi:hypothetical protein